MASDSQWRPPHAHAPSAENSETVAASNDPATRRIPSSELFAEALEVQILHGGETYRLRQTRAGKLILTK